MKTVFKYLLETVLTRLELPVDAIPRHFNWDPARNVLALWAEVDTTEQVKEERWFEFFGTGTAVDDDALAYIGTSIRNGIVFHLYEVPVRI